MSFFRRSLFARASSSSSLAWRAAFLLLASSATAWAAGCSDEDPPATPINDPDGGAPDAYVPPQDARPPGRDCTNDLNDDGIWTHLECSGLYSSFADKTVSADAKPYKPAAEFWSDGAEKSRWAFLPAGQKIDISEWNEWTFPVGTKFWKEFKLGGKRIETRLYTKLADQSWAHTSYRWNADETDAVAKNGGESVPGLGPDGGTYEIPNSGNCETCHYGRKDQILGFEAVNLGLPGATGQTLEKLVADGWLSAAPPKTALEIPTGPPNTAPDKAKAAVPWLHTNCGACHNKNTNAAASFTKVHFLVHAEQLAPSDGGVPAPFAELDVYAEGYCKDSTREENPNVKYVYLRGKAPTRSLVSVLSGRRVPEDQEPSSTVQMPPIVTRAVDIEGHKLVDDWITALPACP
jgi:hypothetical protein